jgi:hypothetical protein
MKSNFQLVSAPRHGDDFLGRESELVSQFVARLAQRNTGAGGLPNTKKENKSGNTREL